MGSKVGQQITSWVYVDGGAAATVVYAVYDENGDLFASGNMTHKGGARFYANWTPDAIGIWTVLCTSSTPSFSALLTYHAGMGQEADILANLATVNGHVSGIKGAGWTVETLKAIYDALPGGGGGGLQAPKFYIENYSKAAGIAINTWYEIVTLTNIDDLKFWIAGQSNTPNDADEYSHRITIDTKVFDKTNTTMTHDLITFMSMGSPSALGAIAAGLNMNEGVPYSMGWMARTGAVLEPQKKVGGHSVKFEWRIDEAPPAGLEYKADIYYTKFEAV